MQSLLVRGLNRSFGPFGGRSFGLQQRELFRQKLGPKIQSRAFGSGKYEDLSLEGRYSGALMQVCKEKNNIDEVFSDLDMLRSAYNDSKDFKLFIDSPAISPKDKTAVLTDMSKKYSWDGVTVNYLKTLLENKRLSSLQRMVDNFEMFYRHEKGQVMVNVVSAKKLSQDEQKKVESALSARANKGSQLIVNYSVNDGILGGLIVKMGEQVLDFSVNSRLERLTARLVQPL